MSEEQKAVCRERVVAYWIGVGAEPTDAWRAAFRLYPRH